MSRCSTYTQRSGSMMSTCYLLRKRFTSLVGMHLGKIFQLKSMKINHAKLYVMLLVSPYQLEFWVPFSVIKKTSEWKEALSRLKKIPSEETLKVLELSYESLEDDYKEIFLDVACFLRHWKKDDAIRMLESCGFHATNGLRVLEQKSLIKIVGTFRGGFINMHDRVIEMGENIVRREHPDEPERHSRLWVQEEIECVLADNSVIIHFLVIMVGDETHNFFVSYNTYFMILVLELQGSEATRCIIQRITPGISLEGMGNMKKLRCLTVNYTKYKFVSDCVKIDEVLQYFPNSLRYLYWMEYPYWCLPKTFKANNLVALEMSFSKIKQLWEGGKIMKKLKFLNLSNSKELRSLDLGLTPNLERLNLEDCKKLVALVVHGGCLKTLVYLNLSYCDSLKSLSFIEQFESLEVLDIGGLNLKEIPDYIITGHSRNTLLELNLSWNMIEEVPLSIGNLHKLVSLNLYNCSNLKSLPGSICSLQHLRTLNLSYTVTKELPEDLGQLECLEELDLTCTNVKHLPGSICILKHLNTLILWGCKYLEKLPEDVGQLESLGILDLRSCSNLREIPNSICKLKCLKELKLF
ncbi:disease resistance protein RUN1-like isoform X1 [Helianthus annuus]|uniref:disease resistance protein RUN1-like isoform X1 n=1 Tax=Helianthus annuus TaxID=4232 RepID=UPI00165314E3|nr:disease resistance protein RUN1-like isoform X1 [Helianthus annuus]XP_035840777.1 disease resistance protein RUN1-like isoform X1 [Helianthus annuus]XP_035840778.1 disease resistance protein RUN1-like isoform X1 [Helianthus annuus]XP_035840779.1 disease resistance protein RUN1-like isoform X1 [Helianthus annuus]XP_035840780.1 disease resistance protein RUN1-like isoform X1 [Helianthus annuus]XP_035840781.1 disease resistance protein RUN1-like isoform X1 [Helianthus annuus]